MPTSQELLQSARRMLRSPTKRPAVAIRKEQWASSRPAVDLLLGEGRSILEVAEWLIEQHEPAKPEKKSATWWRYYDFVHRRHKALKRQQAQQPATAPL